MENSGTCLGIRGKVIVFFSIIFYFLLQISQDFFSKNNARHQDGVVFACEKIVTSKLYEAGANRRITNIDTHVGMAAAGLVTDARQLAEIARFFLLKTFSFFQICVQTGTRRQPTAVTMAPPSLFPTSSNE